MLSFNFFIITLQICKKKSWCLVYLFLFFCPNSLDAGMISLQENFRQKLCDDCLLFAALQAPPLTIPNTVCPPFKARNHFWPDPLILNF